MIAVISPAKSLDYQRPIPAVEPTIPVFAQDAHKIARSAARMSMKRVAELMHISGALAKLNVERFRNFETSPERPAIYAFAGDVYAGFDANSLDEPAIAFAQGHVRILSGLYGLLRPLDTIRPYRLEMGTRWAPRRGDLYAYWQGRIARRLADDAQAGGGKSVVVNLASKEYWSAVAGKLPPDLRVLTIDFREQGPSGLRFNSFAAKRARGMMARFICEHRLSDPEALKAFDSDGYRYDRDGSDDDKWRFMRA